MTPDYDPDEIVVRSTEDRRPRSEYDPAPPTPAGRIQPREASDQYRTLRDVYSVDRDEGVGEPNRPRRPSRRSRIENG
ncbi:hypothetical protein [Actinophytocola xinjiangensis]|uniref:hypothetical protein n=1 Tax=Actinophytocola xinjiangensis TaxID=485602 RepID=UPI000AF31EFD|nr:hypothetical protein [Actinophytocola xinjiangensis]